jgi:hypothetical protein
MITRTPRGPNSSASPLPNAIGSDPPPNGPAPGRGHRSRRRLAAAPTASQSANVMEVSRILRQVGGLRDVPRPKMQGERLAVFVLRLPVQLIQPNQFRLAAVRGTGELTGEPCAGEADQAHEISDPPEPG